MPRGLAYDYVLGGDGLFIAARNRHLDVRIPVAPAAVRGLPALYSSFALRTGRLPQGIWKDIVAVCCAWAHTEREVPVVVVHDGIIYRALRHSQLVGRTAIHYRPIEGVVLEMHSHHRFAARFSPTDDADEQGLRLYGVVGRLGSPTPEVALRAGVYGHFSPVPWESVFDGDRGAFQDMWTEGEGQQLLLAPSV
ncbi:MAG: hypothetical protein GEU73_01010 [Chloroflexi bacterium]|nr:hypothetical protein [Chloroflexota bacterium]